MTTGALILLRKTKERTAEPLCLHEEKPQSAFLEIQPSGVSNTSTAVAPDGVPQALVVLGAWKNPMC